MLGLKGYRRGFESIVLLGLLGLLPLPRAIAQADNDRFEHATFLPDNEGLIQAWLLGAGGQAGEPPNPDLERGNVWFRWTAPHDGFLELEATNLVQSSWLQQVLVFEGNRLHQLALLSPVYRETRYGYRVRGNQAYSLAACLPPSSVGLPPEHVTCRFRFVPPPANDQFENAFLLTGDPVRWVTESAGGSVDSEEASLGLPFNPSFTSVVWYRWQSSDAGLVQITNQGDPATASYAQFFSGTSFANLTALPIFRSAGQFTAQAGESFWIAMLVRPGVTAPFVLEVTRPFHFEGLLGPVVRLPKAGPVTLRPQGIVSPEKVTSYRLTWRDGRVLISKDRLEDYHFPSLAAGTETFRGEVMCSDGRRYDLSPLTIEVGLPNDLFEQRLTLEGTELVFDVDTRGAGRQDSEPSGMRSVWWRWVAPHSGNLLLQLMPRKAGVDVEVFTGSDWQASAPLTPWTVQAGQEYTLRFSTLGREVLTQYRLSLVSTQPTHDSFARRLPIESTPFLEHISARELTAEANEPEGLLGNDAPSVWYSFRAPQAGSIYFGLTLDPEQPWREIPFSYADLFEEESLGTLQRIDSLDRGNHFAVKAAKTYALRIQIPADLRLSSPFVWCDFVSAPPNDSFSNAIGLSGTHVRWNASLGGASAEPSEPPFDPSMRVVRSVWYRWTAPGTGRLAVMHSGGLLPPTATLAGRFKIDVFERHGEGFETLVSVSRGLLQDDGGLYSVQEGVEYAIRLGESGFASVYDRPLDLELHLSRLELDLVPTADAYGLLQAPLLSVRSASGAFDGIYLRRLATGGLTNFPLHRRLVVDSVTNLSGLGGSFETRVLGSGIHWVNIMASNRAGLHEFSPPIRIQLRPVNDDFESAQTLSGTNISEKLALDGGTVQPGEPTIGSSPTNASIWFRWKAPGDGHVSLVANISLVAYQGSSLDRLERVPRSTPNQLPTQASFFTEMGEEFWIQCHRPVLAGVQSISVFSLRYVPQTLIWMTPLPLPSQIGQSIALQFRTDVPGTNFRRAWFQVGSQRVDIPAAPPFQGSFIPTQPGILKVQGYLESNSGYLSVTPILSPVFPQPNADPASAELLSGEAGTFSADVSLGAWESGKRSVWFRWQAPRSGHLVLQVQPGGRFEGTAQLFVGSDSAHLSPAPESPAGGRGLGWQVEAAQDYWIKLSGDPSLAEVQKPILHYLILTPPPNDAFELAESQEGTGWNVKALASLATAELGESALANPLAQTLWWKWTAPAGGVLRLTSPDEMFVYQGQRLESLQLVEPIWTYTSPGGFRVKAGSTYYFRGIKGADGYVTWSAALTPTPANDRWSAAEVLSERRLLWTSSLLATGFETGEPPISGATPSHTLWWRWRAPASGMTVFRLVNGIAPFGLEVFEGNELQRLTRLAAGENMLVFEAVNGRNYSFRVWSNFLSVPEFSVELALSAPPPNDHFGEPTVLRGSDAIAAGWTWGASRELHEPLHGGIFGGRSSWFQWTASYAGRVVVRVAGVLLEPLVSVYVGTSLESLREVTHAEGGSPVEVSFQSVAGETYAISVDSLMGTWGDFDLELQASPPPPVVLSIHPLDLSDWVIQIRGLAGRSEELEASEDLIRWEKMALQVLSRTSEEAVLRLPQQIAPQQYFRVRLSSP